uniref:Uncharacterized protein n=1 Tax=Rhizophagus irregularis (strain DAOM 181602 / DAOM 197198 / MUCL 43194) TaxID=747089 RepID=U9U7V7_RHIID
MDGTPARLGLNPVETEVYNNMIARERITFNALPDDNARIGYVRALVDRDRTWRERSDISQKLIYCGLYVSALIVLAVLGSTKFKNNEETLKYFSLALNSMIFITEIIMLFNKLRWNNIVCMKRHWRKILETKVLDAIKVEYFISTCKLTSFFVQIFRGFVSITDSIISCEV